MKASIYDFAPKPALYNEAFVLIDEHEYPCDNPNQKS